MQGGHDRQWSGSQPDLRAISVKKYHVNNSGVYQVKKVYAAVMIIWFGKNGRGMNDYVSQLGTSPADSIA